LTRIDVEYDSFITYEDFRKIFFEGFSDEDLDLLSVRGKLNRDKGNYMKYVNNVDSNTNNSNSKVKANVNRDKSKDMIVKNELDNKNNKRVDSLSKNKNVSNASNNSTKSMENLNKKINKLNIKTQSITPKGNNKTIFSTKSAKPNNSNNNNIIEMEINLSPTKLTKQSKSPKQISMTPNKTLYKSPNKSPNKQISKSPGTIKSPYRTAYQTNSNYLNNPSNLNTFSTLSHTKLSSNSNRKGNLSLLLNNFFNSLISNELRAETLKENFTIIETVNFNDIFSVFTQYLTNDRAENISMQSFKNGLNLNLNQFVTYDEIRVLFHRYDLDMDNTLSKNELFEMTTPILDSYCNIFKSKLNQRENSLNEKNIKIIKQLLSILRKRMYFRN